jgi:hypothetical protein
VLQARAGFRPCCIPHAFDPPCLSTGRHYRYEENAHHLTVLSGGRLPGAVVACPRWLRPTCWRRRAGELAVIPHAHAGGLALCSAPHFVADRCCGYDSQRAAAQLSSLGYHRVREGEAGSGQKTGPTRRSTEWRPGGGASQILHWWRAAIGELIVRRHSHLMKYHTPLITAALFASLLIGCSKHSSVVATPSVTNKDICVVEV